MRDKFLHYTSRPSHKHVKILSICTFLVGFFGIPFSILVGILLTSALGHEIGGNALVLFVILIPILTSTILFGITIAARGFGDSGFYRWFIYLGIMAPLIWYFLGRLLPA